MDEKLIPNEHADCYQELFNMMNQEHGLVLTLEEMDEIIYECNKVQKKVNELYSKTTSSTSQ